MTEIVKVQRPVTTNDPTAPWLIYDKERKHVQQRPAHLIVNHVKEMMGNDYKMYCMGAWSSVVGWGISKRVKNEAW